MLDKRQFIMFAVFSAIIGGCAMVGFAVMTSTVYAIMQGTIDFTLELKASFGLFIFGAACSVGLLYRAVRGFQKKVSEKIGLDK